METSTIIASILNFAVVVFVLTYFGRKPFAQFLISRSESLKSSIGEAEKFAKEAQVELSKWEANWKSAESHAKKNEMDAKESLKKFQERTLADARHEAERIKKDAALMGDSETSKAKRALQTEVARHSVELAQLHLGEHLAAAEKHKMVSEFVELVGHGAR